MIILVIKLLVTSNKHYQYQKVWHTPYVALKVRCPYLQYIHTVNIEKVEYTEKVKKGKLVLCDSLKITRVSSSDRSKFSIV